MSIQDAPHVLEERGAVHAAGSRNRLPGTVLAVNRQALVAEVEMVCGPYRLVSVMSRETADELDLKPGDPATAVIKSATVFIEPIDGRPPAALA